MQKFPCPCCRSLVYMQPSTGDYSICPICMWEDDPVQMDDPNYTGGANRLSLNQARREYQKKAMQSPKRTLDSNPAVKEMIAVRISKFQASEKCTVELDNFEPKDGLEMFIKTFSEYLGEVLLEWNRGWELGVGRITFKGGEVMLVQSEFPQVFGFDCNDEASAKELQYNLVKFFESEIGHRFAQRPES